MDTSGKSHETKRASQMWLTVYTTICSRYFLANQYVSGFNCQKFRSIPVNELRIAARSVEKNSDSLKCCTAKVGTSGASA